MTTYVLSCVDKADSLDVRMGAREAHLAYVGANREMVKAAGPYLDESGQMAGSMFILEAADKAAVEVFSAADPYRLAGLFDHVDIHVWRVTIGALT